METYHLSWTRRLNKDVSSPQTDIQAWQNSYQISERAFKDIVRVSNFTPEDKGTRIAKIIFKNN